MLRTKLQRGGTLEPVRKTPPFAYTKDPARINWVKALYPYSPYFMNVFKEIPWDSFRYEDDNVTVRLNKNAAAILKGGAAFEFIDWKSRKHIPNDERLHTFADPTADIDVTITAPIVSLKTGATASEDTRWLVKPSNGTFSAMGEAYSSWLLRHIADFFGRLSPNYSEWFPALRPMNQEEFDRVKVTNPAANNAVGPIYFVGPFVICRMMVPEDNGVKIQVAAVLNYADAEGIQKVHYDHFMEFLFVKDEVYPPEEEDEIIELLQKSKIDGVTKIFNLEGVKLFDYFYELSFNLDALKTRIVYTYLETEKLYKFLNHVGRAIFLVKLYEHDTDMDLLTDDDIAFFNTYLEHIEFINQYFKELIYAQRFKTPTERVPTAQLGALATKYSKYMIDNTPESVMAYARRMRILRGGQRRKTSRRQRRAKRTRRHRSSK